MLVSYVPGEVFVLTSLMETWSNSKKRNFRKFHILQNSNCSYGFNEINIQI